ncbi:2,4'-dihydroxyacetophenone dioxygenase family protein [Chromohalobacter nigrandesensis]|uniref:2,4'-dihydroxyacetophenone dioxygenase family protein n=1 Tax=Chromohalobacter nigrandesensis TaxID=119863 RepID=UPI001FF387C8|nr:2,4'-dihydroxyacetophenone dioxygenase family protein [Chromohalobacter nigrandesensis]MCK0744261.1 2,4'-dihydroxyacetophenone dioxygenase family protein [Chromohalobacter nigrandesensis]
MSNAPASSAYKVVEVPEPMKAMQDRFGREGSYVGLSEAESPWVPFGENAAIRHLAFDVRNNVYCNILWIKGPGVIGTHKHRGMVWAVGMEGSFRYLEYDWTCGPGEFITEMPGQAHTLVTDEPNGMKALFWMQGANEFYDENGEWAETLDVFWFINHYVTYCEENGIPINDQLFL